MERRLVVSIVVVAMLVSLVPVGGVTTAAPTDDAAAVHTASADAAVTDRFRAGTATNGLSRVDTDGVLEQPTRAAVYEAVRDSPGIGLSELAETVDVTKSTVRYHVGILRDAGLVGTTEIGGVLRVAADGTNAELAAALRATPTAAVLGAIADRGPASVTTLANETDRALSTVSHHLSALEERGFVDRERRGEAVITTLTDETKAALPDLGPAAETVDD